MKVSASGFMTKNAFGQQSAGMPFALQRMAHMKIVINSAQTADV